MAKRSLDSFNTRRTLSVGARRYTYYSLKAAERAGIGEVSRLPFSLRVLLENLLRHEDGHSVRRADIEAVGRWLKRRRSSREIAYRPTRVLMQDFTGVPAVVDLAAMRESMRRMGGDAKRINPLSPVDLVIDHSVMVDRFGAAGAFAKNVELEYARNGERYAFLRWGQTAFDNFRVVPPGTGICHQVNLEYLAQVVWTERRGRETVAYPDTLVGTDSHTTMVNGLSVLGWGVGGIEAEAAMLGQPFSMLLPEVVGFKLTGRLREGTTATDLVLTVTEMLRKKGVVGKFVEFFGPGLDQLSLADRATLANMAPEYGATCGFFPIDRETIAYLKATARKPARVALVEAYAKAQGIWRTARTPDPVFTSVLALDAGTVEPSLAGPRRPQDRVALSAAAPAFGQALGATFGKKRGQGRRFAVPGAGHDLGHGDVVIAAITSCTNTSNPSVMLGAGLVARNAVKRGLAVKPWVKTSLAPGSKVVSDYLKKAGVQVDLNRLGFNLVGYGCTTCIGNSGPLLGPISETVAANDLVVCSVLSGNRNFEGRISPDVRANYLASPMLVVAYAIAGSMHIDLLKDPLGHDRGGAAVYLKDLWPTNKEIHDTIRRALHPSLYRKQYGNVFHGGRKWRGMKTPKGLTYAWDKRSTYVKHPPYFEGMPAEPPGAPEIAGARVLALLGDSITTDHISPAGAIAAEGPAGRHLIGKRVSARDFNSYGSRRGKPRDNDVRHLRQHPPAQRDGAGHRGRRHPAHARRRANADLRGGDEVPRRGRAAGGGGGQGIRHRLLARLGGQGHPALGRRRGHHRKLRAYPPLQPGRHGRAAAGICRGRHPQDPQARRFRAFRVGGNRERHEAAYEGRLPHHPQERRGERNHADLAHRYRGRGLVLPKWWRAALRAAQHAGRLRGTHRDVIRR